MVVLPSSRAFASRGDFFNVPVVSQTISFDPGVRSIRAQANKEDFQLDNFQPEQVTSAISAQSTKISLQNDELVSKSVVSAKTTSKELIGLKNSPVAYTVINQKVCYEATKKGLDYYESAGGSITFQETDNFGNIIKTSQAPMVGPYELLPSTSENSRCHMLGQRQNESLGLEHRTAPCVIYDSRINALEEKKYFQQQVRNYQPTKQLVNEDLKYTVAGKLVLKHKYICQQIPNWANNSLLGLQAESIKLSIPLTADLAVERSVELLVAPKNSFLSEIMVNDPIQKVKYINDNVLNKWLADGASGAKRVGLQHLLKSCTKEVTNLNVCHTRSVVELQSVSTNNIASNHYSDIMNIELTRFRNLSKKVLLHGLNLDERGLASALKLDDITLSLNTAQGDSLIVVAAPEILTYENYEKFVDKIYDTVIKIGEKGKSIDFEECIVKSHTSKIGDFTKRSKPKPLQFGTAKGKIIGTHPTRYDQKLTNRLPLLRTYFIPQDIDENNYTL